MRNYFNSFFDFFEFDGRPSTDFGVMVFGSGAYSDPEPNETEVKIPGMNGVLHFWDGSYGEVTVSYSVMVKGIDAIQVKEKVERLRAWLLSKRKYCRLRDTFHPDYYRMGIYKGNSDVEYSQNEQMGKLEIKFKCKPQKFLINGDLPIRYEANGRIYNPTDFTASPLIHLYGTANVGAAFNISANQQINLTFPDSGQMIIDTELGEAYDTDGTNLNNKVSFSTTNIAQDFPKIAPGDSAVLMWNVTAVEITPRWWTL